MYKELKSVVERDGQALSCAFNENDEMLICLSKGADCDEFIKSLIRFTLEEAVSTGENQMFLFSSPGHRDLFKNKMFDLARSQGWEFDKYGLLLNGACLSFVLKDSRTYGGFYSHIYAINCFDDKPSIDLYNLMSNLAIYVDRRAIFISIESNRNPF